MPKLKEPSIRARKYIKNKIAGMSDYQAAVKAGYSKNTAVAACQKVENDSVKATIAEAMEKLGISNERLMWKLNEGLEATRIHGTEDNFVEVPDYAIQHKYLTTALELKGDLTKGIEVNGSEIKIAILKYGDSDPLSIHAQSIHVEGLARPQTLPSPQLASESPQDNGGDQSANPVGQPS